MKLLKTVMTNLPLASKRAPIAKKLAGILACAISSCLLMAPVSVMAQSVQLPVNLGTSGNYVILSQTGITDVPPSPIVGNIGASPITGAAIHVSCSEVTGTISSVDAAGPAPCSLIVPGALGVAINDMNTAYVNAAGRPTPDFVNLGAGNITGLTLVPGLYKWGTDVLVSAAGVTLSGGPNAVWIFQIAGDLTLANNAHVMLTGGAQANNIFWQVGASSAGATLGTGSVMNGTILSAKQIIENTGAVLVGRALAQTQVTLQSTSVTTPGPLVGGVPVPLAPTVTSTAPANLGVAVPTNSKVSATFNEAMNPATISAATFTLFNGPTPIGGTVAYVGVTAIFSPSAPLPAGTLLTATITTGAQDPAGLGLAANYVWKFTTAAGPVLTAPTVSSTFPAASATNVPVGNALSATFSETMDPTTITAATFSLHQGATPVAGTVTYSGLTAIFQPSAILAMGTLYTATITNGVKDLLGNSMVANYVWSFTTGSSNSTALPVVSFIFPLAGATNVSVNAAVSATFSEAMNPLTITTASFRLQTGATVIPGTVTYAGLTAVFKPTVSLAANTAFTAVVTSEAADLSGNTLATNYFWSFTTGAAASTTPPTVTSTVPAGGATLVPVGGALAATFSEPMDPTTITNATFSLQQGSTPMAGTVTYSGLTAVFTPAANLAVNASYTATITTGVHDLSGNAMANNYAWSFATGLTVSTLPPTVISTLPANGATAVTTSTNVVANFSEAINPLTVTTATFLVLQGTTPVSGVVIYANNSATFRPNASLSPNILYTAEILNSVADLSGNTLGATYLWTFTTGASGDQPPVCLANFAALAGTAINSTGSTVITGDIGVTPGTSIIGFPPGTFSGAMYTGNNANVSQAMLAVTAAFADATGRSVGPVAVAGDLGGQTLTSGLYRSSGPLQVVAGDLTLDAKGDVNAVFIFQMASTLTTGTARQIILVGGAQAFNVFWQVGTSATLGANSVFNGSILASQSIVLNTGATVNGRLAALAGSVTLQSNVITSPPPFIALGAVLNAAGYENTVAAGSIASVFGNNFSSSTIAATAYPLLSSLGQTSFQVGSQPGPMFMTSCSQTNLQIPWESAGQTQVPVTATVAGLVSPPQNATVAPFSPGIFTMNQSGSGQGMVETAATGQLAEPQGPGGAPVARGQYIAIYATGLGAVTNQPVTGAAALSSPLSYTLTLPTVTIGGISAVVTYSGLAPGFAGLYQVNALVPAGVTPGNTVSLVVGIGTVQSNTVTIAVQ